ncbi:MAG: hypothetical protein INR62_08405 [Rhodospirillales bacterium]|nr:hypothetical protein [Acetobacter sp.]
MMYLEPSEYLAFGLSADTPDAWIAAASQMMESHCRRASLLVTTYTERLRVRRQSGTVQLNYGPVAGISAAKARYATVPRGDCSGLLGAAIAFSIPGQWVEIDASALRLDSASGEVQVPMNLYGLLYSEFEVTYTAGLSAVPDALKVACAQVVKNAQATPGLNVRSSRMDTLQTEYFSDSLLDSQVRSLLRPYVVERLG